MKKLLFLTLLFLVGCAPTSTTTSNPSISEPSTSVSVPIIEEKDLFISEVYASDASTWGRAIEIGNLADEGKCLEGYKLNIYSGKNLTKSIEFSSSDYIDKNGTFVIANKENDVYNYHTKANMILDDNYIFGSNVIELTLNDVVFDTIGSIYKYGYAEYSSHLKLPSFYGPSTEGYDILQFINVRVDEAYDYLGNLECPFSTQEEILEGPKITEAMYAQPFETGSAPGGGFIEATVSSFGDGDTTVFRFNGEYFNIDSSERTRYMNINTPEISHSADGSGAEPWGYAAKTYNNDVLKGAKKILVQSVKGYGFRENYGRLLGYVWYSTKTNPELSDYRLLNLEMVREGYAYYGESGPLKELFSDNIYYTTYFNYVYLYAQKSGIRIHGEKDPNFDY